ncbi:hypothetical protein BGZ70_000043 [Mortierella alpina]|uniref:Uncharacterized protein n=1 Tax=Mortierella alpina TaxID=64518 RepID=A0A9P6M621_MORAP|nr:hypothetical protein BGZ70_000043 [Mortierella alpina]
MVRELLECCPRLEEFFVTEVDMNSLYSAASDDQEDTPWACRDTLKMLCIFTIRVSLDASLNNRFTKQLMDLKQLVEFLTKAIYRPDRKRRTVNPQDVPGSSPEALFLAKLCECRDSAIPLKALKMSPEYKLLKDVWPNLRLQDDDYSEEYANDFGHCCDRDYGDGYHDYDYDDCDDYDYDHQYDYDDI